MSVEGAILNYAESENLDLIVIGTRGRSGITRMLLGSVASEVVTYATCPVMAVKWNIVITCLLGSKSRLEECH